MTTTEFPVNTGNDAVGILFVYDARVLIRPAVPGQYHTVNHDAASAYEILNLGNNMDSYEWHIICHLNPDGAHQMLDRVFYAYVDTCCLSLWCDAEVRYFVDGNVVSTEEYGFSDGCYTMIFNVYCDVAEDDMEAFCDRLTSDVGEAESFVKIQTDTSEIGYSVRGFTVEQSAEDDFDGDPYGAEDEDDECPGGCGQPAYACVCAELVSLQRYNATPLEERCGPWTA